MIKNRYLRELQQQLGQLRIGNVAQTRDRILANGGVRVARVQQLERLVRVQRGPRLERGAGWGVETGRHQTSENQNLRNKNQSQTSEIRTKNQNESRNQNKKVLSPYQTFQFIESVPGM